MRGITTFAAALVVSAPAAADDRITDGEQAAFDKAEVLLGANAFFAALRSEDKTALATAMVPDGMIFIHDRRDPDNTLLHFVPIADHLERWASGTRSVDEVMAYETVLIDGDMAHVWGPYRFAVDGDTTHCGINSMSMVKTDRGWKVANTSFSMVAPSECDAIGAPGFER